MGMMCVDDDTSYLYLDKMYVYWQPEVEFTRDKHIYQIKYCDNTKKRPRMREHEWHLKIK